VLRQIHQRDLADSLTLRERQTEIEAMSESIRAEEQRLDGLDVNNLLRERDSLEQEMDKLTDEVLMRIFICNERKCEVLIEPHTLLLLCKLFVPQWYSSRIHFKRTLYNKNSCKKNINVCILLLLVTAALNKKAFRWFLKMSCV